jgi:hypothetical protein
VTIATMIDAERFIEVITQHPVSARIADDVVRERLPPAQPAGA